MCMKAINRRENRHFVQFTAYSYEDLKNDLHIFSRIFQENLRVDSLGKTADNREIYHVCLGKKDAGRKVLITASMHGREYMTSQLVMDQMADFVHELQAGGKTRKGVPYKKLLEDYQIHVVPMVNPDGVTISQFGADAVKSQEIRDGVWEIARKDGARMPWQSYFRLWKANARGVDINRNFDACWEEYMDGAGRPSSEHYKGEKPEDTEEAAALAALTRKEKFCRTISYHSSGAVIYWSFGQTGELAERTRVFAERIAHVTGYEPDGNYEELDPAGYKDWALLKMGIPSLTIEIGRATSPLPQSAYKKIKRENKYVWEEMLADTAEDFERRDSEQNGK